MAIEQRIDTDRIVQDPEILGGKPVVKGTRIAVEVVLGYLAHNPGSRWQTFRHAWITFGSVDAS